MKNMKRRFVLLKRSDVSAVMFRPGNLYIEQQISDKESFGIVDRMIVSDDLITIIDYKSGSMRGEAQAKIRGTAQALHKDYGNALSAKKGRILYAFDRYLMNFMGLFI